MPLHIVKTDILDLECDAIVNPTNEVFYGRDGLDGRIHKASGPALREECDKLGRRESGFVTITPSFQKKNRYVIHIVVPSWHYAKRADELESLLRSCYRKAFAIAEQRGLRTIAFPLVGGETVSFDKALILRVAVEELGSYVNTHDVTFYLAIDHGVVYKLWSQLDYGLEDYILELREQPEEPELFEDTLDAAESETKTDDEYRTEPWANFSAPSGTSDNCFYSIQFPSDNQRPPYGLIPYSDVESSDEQASAFAKEVDNFLKLSPTSDREKILDESFSQMVLRLIDEKGFKKDSDCYRKANIDKRLFSKIRSDKHYHPKKITALAFAVALELPIEQTRELLMKAGYTLSRSIFFDVILEYCILQENYNIHEINAILYEYDLPLLGG